MAPDMSTYTEAERLELRAHVRVAGEITGTYWPMRTFIHHNPLHGLEELPFHDAIQRANQFLRGRGYLPNEAYRAYFRQGTISPRHVEAVLRPLAQDGSVTWGTRTISHLDVLRAHFLQGIGLPTQESPETWLAQSSESERLLITILAAALRDIVRHRSGEAGARAWVDEDLAGLGRFQTLAGWCDQTLGTELTDLIDSELSKWCAAFLDEGQAAWPMPHRDAMFYGTWKSLAQMEPNGFRWGIPDWKRKVAALPERPEDALLESLQLLGIPRESWQDYFALHLGALVGWSGFIRWRSEQQGYAWQEAYPASLVKYLAIRLFYERELVAVHCRRALGIDGSFPAMRDYMHWHPLAYVLRRERVAGRLPDPYARDVDRLALTQGASADEWDTLAERYLRETAAAAQRAAGVRAAWQLLRVAYALDSIPPSFARRRRPNCVGSSSGSECFRRRNTGCTGCGPWKPVGRIVSSDNSCRTCAMGPPSTVAGHRVTPLRNPQARVPKPRPSFASTCAPRCFAATWRRSGITRPSGLPGFLFALFGIGPSARSMTRTSIRSL